MKNKDGEIQTVSFSRDFKNNAGPKKAIFFFAEDFIYFVILLPAVLLFLHILKAGTAAFATIPALLAGLWLITYCRLKPRKLWSSILLTFLSAILFFVIFLAAGNYLASGIIFFDMILSYVKTGHNFSQLYEKKQDHIHKWKVSYSRKKTSDSRDCKERDTSSLYLGKGTVIFSAVLNFAFYIAAIRLGFNSVAYFCILDFAVVFVFVAVYNRKSGEYCLSQWDKLFKIKSGAKSGGKQTDKAGSSLLSFLTAVSAAVITLILFFIAAADRNFRTDNAVMNALSRFFQFTPAAPRDTAASSAPANHAADSIAKQLANQTQKPSAFADVIKNVLIAAGWCIIILAAVFVIIAISSSAVSFYRKLNVDINESHKSLLFTKKKDKTNKKIHFVPIKKRFDIFSHIGNRPAIRRLFFLYMKRHRAKIMQKSDTPHEMGQKATCGGDMKTAVEIYEKARYSTNVCEDADVRNMKQALRSERSQRKSPAEQTREK